MLTSRVKRQISKLIDAYSEGLIDKHEFEPRIRGAPQHLENLRAEAQSQEQLQAQIREMRLVIGRLETFADRVRGSLDNADWATRRQLITTLVKRVEVGQQEVRVIYRVDCGSLDTPPSAGSWQDCWRRREATGAPTRGPRPKGGRRNRSPVFPLFGIGTKAINPSRRSRELWM
ncbi:MAG: hypothetical protein GTO22_01715 [Gemmatimonadales bacterium]|nr:hypothetical protein [Gemmatimonadales bacterium]